jgi:1-aminocyclopropane-1-carboxylate deaminase/D-cysteine desulfhydrase-like pyridoxal-dependent ACC family enzyme
VPSGASEAGRVAQLIHAANRELHARDARFPVFDEPLGNVELRPELLGPGYAETTPAATEAVALMREHGLTLETTYTGKAFAGLVADARAGRLAGRRVVFWHTYSSAPYPEALAGVDLAGLPDELRPYLAGD